MKYRINACGSVLAAFGMLFGASAQAFDMGNIMNPSKWMGGNRDRDRDYYDDYGPGYGYGGPPPYGYGAPGYGYGAPGYGYGAPGYGYGAPGYGYGAPGVVTTTPGYGTGTPDVQVIPGSAYGGAPGYGNVTPGVQVVPGSAYGGAPGYGVAPGVDATPPYGYGGAPYGAAPPYGGDPGYGAPPAASDSATADTIERLQERIRLLEESARQAPPASAPTAGGWGNTRGGYPPSDQGSSSWGQVPDYATPAAPATSYGERPAYQYR